MPSTYNPGPRSMVVRAGRSAWDVTSVSEDGMSGFAVSTHTQGRIFWRREDSTVLATMSDDGAHASQRVDLHEIDTVVVDGAIWGQPGAKIGTAIVGLTRGQTPGWGALWAEANGLRHTSDSVNAR